MAIFIPTYEQIVCLALPDSLAPFTKDKFSLLTKQQVEGNLQRLISSEPMVFDASPSFALKHGGPITAMVMDEVLRRISYYSLAFDRYWRIDTRVHMLMPGQYPAIGGWHCDSVPRGNYQGQPMIEEMDEDPHFTLTFSTGDGSGTGLAGISQTQFITNRLELDIDEKAVWRSASEAIKTEKVILQSAPDGALIHFTSSTLHRATPARMRGWRYFFRCSAHYEKPVGQIRKQVQVYSDIEGGW